MLELAFEHLEITRQRFAGIIENYSFEELNTIPETHNNSMLWNYGHSIVTQHLLSFGVSGLELEIPMDIVNRYRKGTAPKESELTQADLDYFNSNSERLFKLAKETYDRGGFANFKSYTTSFGVELDTIEAAILFNNIHMGMHFGYLLAIRKLIK